MVSNKLFSFPPANGEYEKQYVTLFKDVKVNHKVIKFNSLAEDTSYSYANPRIKIIEPSLIHLIVQREMLIGEINYYDVNHIKTNKIKRLELLTIHSKRAAGEDSVGIKEIYDYDTSGNVVKSELKQLKTNDFFINEFLYHHGKLNQVILTRYTEFNDLKTIDTFLVVTNVKNNISEITPLSKTPDRCLPSYSLAYDAQNNLKSIMRTVACRIIDTTWTQFNRDYSGRVLDMSYGKCSQRFFARDHNRRISEVIEIHCFARSERDFFISTWHYDKSGNLSSTDTDKHELGDDVHFNRKIYLKYGAAGVIESREKQAGKLYKTTKVTYEFF